MDLIIKDNKTMIKIFKNIENKTKMNNREFNQITVIFKIIKWVFQNGSVFQHFKINQCNSAYKQTKKNKNRLKKCRKTFSFFNIY